MLIHGHLDNTMLKDCIEDRIVQLEAMLKQVFQFLSVALIKHSDQKLRGRKSLFQFLLPDHSISLREVKAGTGRQASLLFHTAPWSKELPSQLKYTGTMCTCCFLAGLWAVTLSLLSYTVGNHLPRDAAAHGGLDLLTSIKIILQSCPQANLIQAIPQLRPYQVDLTAIQDSKQVHGNKAQIQVEGWGSRHRDVF